MGGIRSSAVVLVAGALLGLPAPGVAQAVVITNASIVDASAAASVRVGSIVIEDGRITGDPKLIPVQFDSIVNRLNGSLGDSIFAVMKANRTFSILRWSATKRVSRMRRLRSLNVDGSRTRK